MDPHLEIVFLLVAGICFQIGTWRSKGLFVWAGNLILWATCGASLFMRGCQ